ncbi:MAG: hypothetical protein GY739_12990, partial [Mesoflavibacter sp.]|nr:hypothetical protein [Mesoflavibacter sp.]
MGVSGAQQKLRDYLCLLREFGDGFLYEGCLEALHGYMIEMMNDSAVADRRRVVISLSYFLTRLLQSTAPGDIPWESAVDIFFNQVYTSNEYRRELREEKRAELA